MVDAPVTGVDTQRLRHVRTTKRALPGAPRRLSLAASLLAIVAACAGPAPSASPAPTASPAATVVPTNIATPVRPSPTPATTIAPIALPVLGHTATLLLNGTVLVAGGAIDPESRAPVNSAETYDPATNAWSTTGAMGEPRSGHVAVLLEDGRVLVAGGTGSTFEGLATAELYDPTTRTWTSAGALSTALDWLAATRLGTGDVLAVSQNHAELYDHVAGSWSVTAPWAADRGNLSTLTTMANGKVLVAGGGQREGCAITEADVFDPARGTWATTGRMKIGHMEPSAALLDDGRVLVVGQPCDFGAWTELYAPGARTWTSAGPLHHGLGSAIALPTGGVLVLGAPPNEDPLPNVERFDPGTSTWTELPSLHVARGGHTATLLPNGLVLVVGGDAPVSAASVELYDPSVPG